jgi:CubicO group peptidase (beta-lactamase class C family)
MKYLALLVVLAAITLACKNKTNHTQIAAATVKAGDFNFRALSGSEKAKYAAAIEDFYNKILVRSGFSGSILVAKNGQVLFEAYRGSTDYYGKTPITAETPFHLASVSKTLTGTTLLRFWEQGRIALNDSLQQYFPNFPYHGITVQMLLNHRSGLPNYLHFMDKGWNKKVKATNQDVLQFMIDNKPAPNSWPDKRFHYCNTNYVLIALIIEKLSGMPFPQYMKDSVFTPLGMKHSFVFSKADTANYVPTFSGKAIYNMDHLDCTYGDKNIYSTVQDLLLWDKAIYGHTFVSKPTLDAAFTPYSNERPSVHNYGLGWRLLCTPTNTVIYHNGKWHGNNTAFTRLTKDTATIIVLGNRTNRAIYHSRKLATVFSANSSQEKLEE